MSAIYVVAIPLSYGNSWIAMGLIILVAVLWCIPDKRIEKGSGSLTSRGIPLALLLAGSVLARPAPARATAGFAETHSEVAYNRFAALHWIHPGDGCDAGSYCFQVHRADNKYAGLKDLYASLQKINRPADGALIIGETCADGKWFVYDLGAEAFVTPPGTEGEARAAWISRGKPVPPFWDAKEGGPGLHETWESRIENWGFPLFLMSPLLVLLGVPVSVGFAWRFYREYRRTRRAGFAALAALLLMPAVLLLVFVARVFVPVLARR